MKNRKLSISASVINQYKSKSSAESDGSKLKQIETSRLDINIEGSSSDYIRVIFPGIYGPSVYDLSPFSPQVQFGPLIAAGFRIWAGSVSQSSRLLRQRILNRYFAGYLNSLRRDVDVYSVDEAFWNGFKEYLLLPSEKNSILRPVTRRNIIHAVGMVLQSAREDPQYSSGARYLMDRSGYPRNPWRDLASQVVPTKTISHRDKQQIITACLKEIEELADWLVRREAIKKDGREQIAKSRIYGIDLCYKSLGASALLSQKVCGENLINIHTIYNKDRQLYNAAKNRHRINNIKRIFYNTYPDLVPFVIPLTFLTAFNPETILSLKWSDVKYSYDGSMITITGRKMRSLSGQSSSVYSDEYEGSESTSVHGSEIGIEGGLHSILQTLKELTEGTRQLINEDEFRDNIFIGAPQNTGLEIRPLSNHECGVNKGTGWSRLLILFIQKHNLNPFTLKSIRATEAEDTFLRTGDLLAVRDRLGHKSVQTTRTHYTSDWVRKVFIERIGETQELLVRWANSEGQIDPRGRMTWEQGATTPGFFCHDPFDSPKPGQQRGSLCTAYGECPTCPLAAARIDQAHFVALYSALREAIVKASLGRNGDKAWATKWSQIVLAIDQILDAVPIEILEQSRNYKIQLKAIT